GTVTTPGSCTRPVTETKIGPVGVCASGAEEGSTGEDDPGTTGDGASLSGSSSSGPGTEDQPTVSAGIGSAAGRFHHTPTTATTAATRATIAITPKPERPGSTRTS